MAFMGSLIGALISAGTVYYTAYRLNYGMYTVIGISIAVFAVYKFISSYVSFLNTATPANQPWYLSMLNFLVGIVPSLIYYFKFGITGIIVSAVLNIIASVILAIFVGI
jgi:hypothetical protein